MIRTRAVIERLSYDTLVKQGLIPNVYPLIEQAPTAVATKRYPPFVYQQKEFAFFGLFWDYMVRAGLRLHLPNTKLGTDPCAEMIQALPDAEMMTMITQLSTYETGTNMHDIATAALALVSGLYGKEVYTVADIQGYVPTIVNALKELATRWQVYGQLDGPVQFNAEYVHGQFSGHPDIVTNRTVLDIKTTTSFLKMAKESCLQVLAYYALMKPSTPTVQYIGFVLPMQREVILYNLGDWNSTPYLQLLSSEADKLASAIPKQLALPTGPIVVTIAEDGTLDTDAFLGQFDDETAANALMELIQAKLIGVPNFALGGHIAKGKDLAVSLRDFATHCPGLPCQMFLRNPRTGHMDAKTTGQLAAAAQVIRETGLQYFTHAAYVINLCSNQCDATGDYWQQRFLNEDLSHTVALGGKGVVVHTGARKKLSEQEALHIMEQMVRAALEYATEGCPLLLETPCREGTEVCADIHDLGNFFYRFTEVERRKLGLCVDSCHVFAAGYDPLMYLQHWEKHCPVPIKLVHFNDSQGECGSCKDRHAAPGHGHIGMEKMTAVARWCHERHIPMVRE